MANSNKVMFGFSDLYIGTYTDNNGTVTMGTPFHQAGAVGFSPEDNVEQNIFYADNIAYYVADSQGTTEGDLVVAKFDDSFLTSFLGYGTTTGAVWLRSREPPSRRFTSRSRSRATTIRSGSSTTTPLSDPSSESTRPSRTLSRSRPRRWPSPSRETRPPASSRPSMTATQPDTRLCSPIRLLRRSRPKRTQKHGGGEIPRLIFFQKGSQK